MAKYRRRNYQTFISSSGIEWFKERCPSILSVCPVMYTTEVNSVRYMIQKYRDEDSDGHRWFLYTCDQPGFYAEPCSSLLLISIDQATEMIVKADLRGDGYERPE